MPFEDYGGLEAKNGYIINGDFFSNHVSFRPPFYSCIGCMPDEISSSFKKSRYWYDDDLINVQGGNKKFVTDDTNDEIAAQSDDQFVNEYLNDDAALSTNSTSLTDDLSNYFASFVDDTLASISSSSNATVTTDDGGNETQDEGNRFLIREDKYRVLSADQSVFEVRLRQPEQLSSCL